MILSFHPCYVAGENRLCAGRDPDAGDLDAISRADAVILPQGCRWSLYEAARRRCNHVFPNYNARFQYPEKIGQARLFQTTGVPHPKTETFEDTGDYFKKYPKMESTPPFPYPFVFKFNWGGEGETVYLISSPGQLEETLDDAVRFEHTGQKGFLIQTLVPTRNRVLRVAVIGTRIITYWRVRTDDEFSANLARGGIIDHESDPDLQALAADRTRMFCEKTGIDLAGLDILFADNTAEPDLFFLEINYFFGRRGLGGSEKYYESLVAEIDAWLQRKHLE